MTLVSSRVLNESLMAAERRFKGKRRPPIGDCKPKIQQTSIKRPRVNAKRLAVQGICRWHSGCNAQVSKLGQNEKDFKDREGGLMKNKVVLITGALTGIGRATALAFAREGVRIVISGRHQEEGENLVNELGKLGAEAEFVRSDVRHEDDVRSLVDKTVARFGRLDVAVNTAGTEGK